MVSVAPWPRRTRFETQLAGRSSLQPELTTPCQVRESVEGADAERQSLQVPSKYHHESPPARLRPRIPFDTVDRCKSQACRRATMLCVRPFGPAQRDLAVPSGPVPRYRSATTPRPTTVQSHNEPLSTLTLTHFGLDPAFCFWCKYHRKGQLAAIGAVILAHLPSLAPMGHVLPATS